MFSVQDAAHETAALDARLLDQIFDSVDASRCLKGLHLRTDERNSEVFSFKTRYFSSVTVSIFSSTGAV